MLKTSQLAHFIKFMESIGYVACHGWIALSLIIYITWHWHMVWSMFCFKFTSANPFSRSEQFLFVSITYLSFCDSLFLCFFLCRHFFFGVNLELCRHLFVSVVFVIIVLSAAMQFSLFLAISYIFFLYFWM